MKLNEPVSNIMSKHVFTVNMDGSLHEAKALFDKYKVRHLPVVSGSKLVGIISLTDILRMSFGETYGEHHYEVDSNLYTMLTVDEVMKTNPHTVRVKDNIMTVINILIKEEFHALPVVNKEALVGIVTTTDIIKYLVQDQLKEQPQE